MTHSYRKSTEEKHRTKKHHIASLQEAESRGMVKEWIDEACCLNSAYERKAMSQGLNKAPVFDENK